VDPQERTNRHPVLEIRVLKEPRRRSFILGLARNVIIRGRVWRRKPFVNDLFYLRPWYEGSVLSVYNAHKTRRRSQTLCFLHIIRYPLYSHVSFVGTYADDQLV
jgi:hypothetical protein